MASRMSVFVGLACGFLLLMGQYAGSDDKNKDDDKTTNAKERVEAIKKVYKGMEARWKNEVVLPGFVPVFTNMTDFFETRNRWSLRWMEAEQESSDKKADQIAAATAHLERMRKDEKVALGMKKALAPYEAEIAKFFRLDAEKRLMLAKEK